MARNLIEAGYSLAVWNRTRAKAEPLEKLGAHLGETPAEAVAGADVIVSVLENGSVVASILFESGAWQRMRQGALVIDMSSIAPDLACAHAERLRTAGIGHLDAPVSGGPAGAEAGTLAIMVGGEAEDVAWARPVLEVLGRPTHVGPAGAGQLAKLCSQMIAAAAVGAVSEMMLLAAAGGADPEKVRIALTGGFADSKILQIHGQRMLAREFEPGGHVRTFLKDLDAAAAIAARRGLDLPVVQLTRDLFAALAAHGGGNYDIAALLLEFERRNPTVRVGTARDHLPPDQVSVRAEEQSTR